MRRTQTIQQSWETFPVFNLELEQFLAYALILDDALVPPVAVPYDAVTAGGQTPCFIATATGITGTRPGNQGDIFAIDCNNNKNF